MSLSRKTPLKPSTKPMARSAFKPKPATEKKAAPAPQEPKGRKPPKQRKCAWIECRQPFMPGNSMQVVCGPECAQKHGAAVTAKQRAKQQRQERAQDKIRLEGMKTYPQLVREAQKAFNEVVRLRDRLAGYPCISSGRPLDWSGNAVDCGHYRSTGSAPHLRFNFDNAHAQSKHDNQYKSGNAVDYRLGLIARIGLDRVEALEADNMPRKWTHDELRAMKADFQAMARQLKKELQL